MSFEEVVVGLLQRDVSATSNSLDNVKRELKEMNKTLQFIGIQLKTLNENMEEIKKTVGAL